MSCAGEKVLLEENILPIAIMRETGSEEIL